MTDGAQSALFLSARRNTLWCVRTSLRRAPALEALAVSCSTVNVSNAPPATPPALPAKELAPRSLRRGEDEVIRSLRWVLFLQSPFFLEGQLCPSSCQKMLKRLQGRSPQVFLRYRPSSPCPAPQRRQTHWTHCQLTPHKSKA